MRTSILLASVIAMSVLAGCASGFGKAEFTPRVKEPDYFVVIPYEHYDDLIVQLEAACIALGNPECECEFE